MIYVLVDDNSGSIVIVLMIDRRMGLWWPR